MLKKIPVLILLLFYGPLTGAEKQNFILRDNAPEAALYNSNNDLFFAFLSEYYWQHNKAPVYTDSRLNNISALYIAFLQNRRWSVREVMQNLEKPLENSQLQQWLEKYTRFKEPSKFVSSAGGWAYPAAVFYFNDRKYLAAASLFRGLAEDLRQNEKTLKSALVYAWLADYSMFQHTVSQNIELNRNRNSFKTTNLDWFRKNKPAAYKSLKKTLPVPDSDSVSSTVEIRRSLKNWARPATAERQQGRLKFVSDHPVEIAYYRDSRKTAVQISYHKKKLLSAIDNNLYWHDRSIAYRSTHTVHNGNRQKNYLNLVLSFPRENYRRSFKMNFGIAGSPLVDPGLDQLFSGLAQREQIAVRLKKSAGDYGIGRQRIYLVDASSVFDFSEITLTGSRDTARSVRIKVKGEDKELHFDNLAFGSRFKKAELSHNLASNQIYRLEYPLQKKLLDTALLSRIQSTPSSDQSAGKNSSDSENSENRKTIRRALNDLYRSSELSVKQLKDKVDDYHSLFKENGNSQLLLLAARFAYLAYDYERASRLIESYYLNSENAEDETRLSADFSARTDADDIYILSLINADRLKKAEAFLESRLATRGIPEENRSGYLLALADIHTRSGRIAQAVAALEKLKHNPQKQYSNTEKQSVIMAYRLLVLLHGREGDFKKAGLYRKRLKAFAPDFDDNLPAEWPARAEKAVRLDFKGHIPGRGRNYCVPVATQYILRYLKKSNMSQLQIAEAMKTTEQGTAFSSMIEFFRKRNINVTPFTGSPARVEKYLTSGKPVMTLLHPPGAPQGHAVIITGLDKPSGLYYLYEPSNRLALSAVSAADLQQYQTTTGNLYFAFGSGEKPGSTDPAVKLTAYIDRMTSGAAPRELNRQLATLQKSAEAGNITNFLRLQQIRNYTLILSEKDEDSEKVKEKAAVTLDKAIAAENAPAVVDSFAARLAFTLGRADTAVTLLERAIKKEPADAGSHLMLADLHLRMNRIDKAEKELKTALKYLPAVPGTEQNRNAILVSLARIAAKRKERKEMMYYLLSVADFSQNNRINARAFKMLQQSGARAVLGFLQNFVLPRR